MTRLLRVFPRRTKATPTDELAWVPYRAARLLKRHVLWHPWLWIRLCQRTYRELERMHDLARGAW